MILIQDSECVVRAGTGGGCWLRAQLGWPACCDRRHQRCQLHRVLGGDLLEHVWWVKTRCALGLISGWGRWLEWWIGLLVHHRGLVTAVYTLGAACCYTWRGRHLPGL